MHRSNATTTVTMPNTGLTPISLRMRSMLAMAVAGLWCGGTVYRIMPVHEAQLLTYLRLSGHRVGLLLHFNTVVLKDDIHRLVL